MSEFKGVTVIKKANVFFDGKVVSRSVIFPDGSKKTLGIMQPGGAYDFTTAGAEVMEIISGALEVQVGAGAPWRMVRGGESFEVPANTKFTMKVSELTDYCCSFVK